VPPKRRSHPETLHDVRLQSEYINHCLKGGKMLELVRCQFSGLVYFAYSDENRDLYSSPNISVIKKYMNWMKVEINVEFW